MPITMRLPLPTLLAIQLSLTACGPELPDTDWEGENVIFASNRGMPCEETLEFLDSSIEKLGERLGTSLGDGEKIKYYWLTEDFISDYCTSGHLGCAGDNVILSVQPFIAHEIVHILSNTLGRAHKFFSEGLAVSYGEIPIVPSVNQDLVGDIRKNLVPNLDVNDLTYQAAGFFTRYLIETYGLTEYLELYSQTTREDSFQDFEDLFEEILNVTLNDVLDTISDLSRDNILCHAPPPLCLLDSHPWKNESLWEYSFDTGCIDAENLGPFSYYNSEGNYLSTVPIQDGELQHHVVFEVAIADNYHIWVTAPDSPRGYVHLRPCFFSENCSFIADSRKFGLWPEDDLVLPPEMDVFLQEGAYQLEFHLHAPVCEKEVIDVRIDRVKENNNTSPEP